MSNKQVSQVASGNGFVIGEEQIKTLSAAGIIPAGTPPAQVEVFAHMCNVHGMDPFAGEIHLVGYNSREGMKYSVVTGIHGLERRAAESEAYAGVDSPKFNVQEDGKFMTMAQVAASKQNPVSCKVTVYKIVAGLRVAFDGEVLFNEFAGTTSQWRSRPIHMIAKCALANALRKGFPRQTKGLVAEEEMAAVEGSTQVDLTTVTPPKSVAADIQLSEVEMDEYLVEGFKQDLRDIILSTEPTPESAAESKALMTAVWNRTPEEYRKVASFRDLFTQAGAAIAKKVKQQEPVIEEAEVDDDDSDSDAAE